MTKVLLLGMSNAGKSAIYRETYETLSDAEDNPYKSRILKLKSLQNILQLEFLEENSIEILSKEQIKEIFSNVQVVLWVVDVTDQRTLSTSLFHWKKALQLLKEHSPFSVKFVSLHKIDLLDNEDKDTLFSSLKNEFQSICPDQVNFYYTSLKDDSALVMMAQIMKIIHEASFEIKQVQNKISQFLKTNEDFFGVTILSSDGLPIIEIGERVEFVILPANLWLGTNERLKEAFNAETLSCTIHLSDQTLLFFDIGSDLLLTTIAKKEAPLQFSFIRSDLLAQSLHDILDAP